MRGSDSTPRETDVHRQCITMDYVAVLGLGYAYSLVHIRPDTTLFRDVRRHVSMAWLLLCPRLSDGNTVEDIGLRRSILDCNAHRMPVL